MPTRKRPPVRGPLTPTRVSDGFKTFVLDQLAPLGGLRAHAMFGGVGLYAGETFFGILAADVLYFKVDDRNRADYERANMGAFRPYADRPVTMSYYEVPLVVLEDSQMLANWARKAIEVAQTGKTARRSPGRRAHPSR
jgi:DNA transformation protein and related proteins